MAQVVEFGTNGKDLINEETIEFMTCYIDLECFTSAVAKNASKAVEVCICMYVCIFMYIYVHVHLYVYVNMNKSIVNHPITYSLLSYPMLHII